MFPENIVQATFQQVQTKYIKVRPKLFMKNDTRILQAWSSGALDIEKPVVEKMDGINVLGNIFL